MNFEVVDNVFQVVILAGAMTASAVTALRSRKWEFLMLSGGYGCFMMGTLYYVLYLVILGQVPQIFYVAEISWLAAYVFYLSLSLSRRKLFIKRPGPVSIIAAVAVFACFVGFHIFGPAILSSLAFGVTVGILVMRSVEGMREYREDRLLNGIMILVCFLQISLYEVSSFIRDYTRFNLYFALDICLTLLMVSMYPALKREVRRKDDILH